MEEQNFEQEVQQEYNPVPHEELVENKKSWKLILGIVVILSLILLGAGIYWTLNDAEIIVENKKVNKINQDEKIVLDIAESNKLDEKSPEDWNEVIDYYWAFSMSFPPEMNISMIDGNDGLMSEDKSFIIEIGGSDIIFDLSNPSSYKPFIDLIEADEKTSEGEIIIINDRYLYNYIMKYPEEYGLGMKEYYLLMKDDHVYSASFLLNEAENIEEQQLNNRRIMDTLKFFKPVATGLEGKISKYTQGVGLSTVVLQGELTEDRALYPEYSYSHNIRNNDNPVENYLNTEFGQIVVYYKDKLICSKTVNVEGNLHRLSPRWASDRETYGYYMDVTEYECIDSNSKISNEESLVYHKPSLNFTVSFPNNNKYTGATAAVITEDGKSVGYYQNGNMIYILEDDQDLTLKQYKFQVETIRSITMEETNINDYAFVYSTSNIDEYNYFKQEYITIINKKMYFFSFRLKIPNFSEEEKQKQRDFARSIVETFEIK